MTTAGEESPISTPVSFATVPVTAYKTSSTALVTAPAIATLQTVGDTETTAANPGATAGDRETTTVDLPITTADVETTGADIVTPTAYLETLAADIETTATDMEPTASDVEITSASVADVTGTDEQMTFRITSQTTESGKLINVETYYLCFHHHLRVHFTHRLV